MVSPEFLQGFQILWNEMLSSGESEKIKKILVIDGKTQRGNRNKSLSLRKRRFSIGTNPEKYLERVMSM